MAEIHDPLAPERRRRQRLILVAVGSVVALVAVAFLVVALTGDDDGEVETAESTTTTDQATTTSSTVGGGEDEARADVIWPFAGSDTTYGSPEEAALGFATEYIGLADPQVGASRPGLVEVTAGSGPITVVSVEEVGSAWVVTGASSEHIVVDAPSSEGVVPACGGLAVSGTSTAFEGNVIVEVRPAGSLEPVGQSFVTGGANGQMAPFAGEVEVEGTDEPHGAVVLYQPDESGRGQALSATVVPVTFDRSGCDDGDAQAGGLSVFFSRGEEVVAVSRPREGEGVLRTALEHLLAGPTASERSDGLSSSFSQETAGLLLGVRLENGVAVVDLDPALRDAAPSASASAGSEQLLAQLDATVFQFPTVEAVEYRFDGSCDAFFEWLQRGCERRGRPAR